MTPRGMSRPERLSGPRASLAEVKLVVDALGFRWRRIGRRLGRIKALDEVEGALNSAKNEFTARATPQKWARLVVAARVVLAAEQTAEARRQRPAWTEGHEVRGGDE